MKVVFNIAVAAGVALGSVGVASATPRPLPFTYPTDTLPEGGLEIEGYTDVNPLRVEADPADATAGKIWSPEYRLQTEIEYGITDRWEIGFYQVFKASPQAGGDNALQFDGLKWRVRTRLADAGEWPIDVGLYLELETMHDELSLEGKILLQKRLGRVRWMGNLWAEEVYSRPYDSKLHGREANFVINPATGLVFEVTPTFQPGIEYWARGQLVSSGPTEQDHKNTKVHSFLGPTVHLNFGRLWWSFGAYLHVNDTSTPHVGDAYGPVWFRSVLGIEL